MVLFCAVGHLSKKVYWYPFLPSPRQAVRPHARPPFYVLAPATVNKRRSRFSPPPFLVLSYFDYQFPDGVIGTFPAPPVPVRPFLLPPSRRFFHRSRIYSRTLPCFFPMPYSTLESGPYPILRSLRGPGRDISISAAGHPCALLDYGKNYLFS